MNKKPTDINRYRLLGGKYEPITYTLCFFRGDYTYVAECFKKWANNLKTSFALRGVDTKHLTTNEISKRPFMHGANPTSLKEYAFRSVLPLQLSGSRLTFVQCRNNWTAVITNSPKLFVDYTGYTWNMRRLFSLDSVILRYVPNIYPPKNYKELETYHQSYGSLELSYTNPSGTLIHGNSTGRWISLSRQGLRKWDFYNKGEPFDFEDISIYEKRRVTDRFTPELMLQYAQKLGIDPYNIDFYDGPAILYENRAEWCISNENPEIIKPFTPAEARKELKIDFLYSDYGAPLDTIDNEHTLYNNDYTGPDAPNETIPEKSDEFEPLDEYQADSLRLSELQALLPLPVEQVSVGDLNFSFTGNKDNSSFKLYVDCDWRIAPALEKNRLEEFPKNQQEPIKALQGGMIVAVEADTPDAYDPLITVRDIHGEDWVIHILSEDENAPWGVIQNREQIIEGPSWQAHEAWKEAHQRSSKS